MILPTNLTKVQALLILYAILYTYTNLSYMLYYIHILTYKLIPILKGSYRGVGKPSILHVTVIVLL
jgi:hypothetical protein